jgi:hypothetical protein
MRSRELVTSLHAHLAAELKNYAFPDPSGTPHDCRVFLHGLPDTQDARTYPFVCVRWVDSGLEEDGDGAYVTETVTLILGVYAPESQEEAGILLAELMDAVVGCVRRCRLLEHRFQRELPIRAAIPDPERQWNQYHMATVTTTWQYGIPVTPISADGFALTE